MKKEFNLKEYKKDKKMLNYFYIIILLGILIAFITFIKTKEIYYLIFIIIFYLFGEIFQIRIKQEHILKKLEIE